MWTECRLNSAGIGGGISDLRPALNVTQRGISCQVYQQVPEIKSLSVGITLLLHEMKESSRPDLGTQLLAAGIENRENRFFNRSGQLLHKEPRGKLAGCDLPRLVIHRRQLNIALAAAEQGHVEPYATKTNREVADITRGEIGFTFNLKDTGAGSPFRTVEADVVTDYDETNSSIRRTYYLNEPVAFVSTDSWRSLTRRKRISGGRTYMRIGLLRTGKLVIYPVVGDVDGEGNQLIGWIVDTQQDRFEQNDLNEPENLADFLPAYENRRCDRLDSAQMLRDAQQIREHPIADKDPVITWMFRGVTLGGDATHPMNPRGAKGAARALIDDRVLADILVRSADAREALKAYASKCIRETAAVVLTNRQHPPAYVITKVQELVSARLFENLDEFVPRDELRALSENYERTACFALSDAVRSALS